MENQKKPARFHSLYRFVGGTLKNISRLLQVSGSRPHQKRVKALVDCRAVSSEQLAFFKDEIIVVTASHDPHWWVSATTTSLLFHSLVRSSFGLKCESFNMK